jgi:hypothetical protein
MSRWAVVILAGALLLIGGLAGPAWGVRPSTPEIGVRPTSGPVGTQIQIAGRNFTGMCSKVESFFSDSVGRVFDLGTTMRKPNGTIRTSAVIPQQAALGPGTVSSSSWVFVPRITCQPPDQGAGSTTGFTVTS